MKHELVEYGNFGNAIRLYDDSVELVVALDFGIRILKYSLLNGENVFFNDADFAIDTGIDGYRYKIYGGHRLWVSPEVAPKTYWPDDSPPRFEMTADTFRVTAPTDEWSAVEKSVEIRFLGGGSVEVQNHVTNRSGRSAEYSAWSISAMRANGTNIIPYAPVAGEIRSLSLWPHSRMDDPRLRFGGDYIAVGQAGDIRAPLKIGLRNSEGWAAYSSRGLLMVKRAETLEGARYPDGDASYEVFANERFLEMEYLSPLGFVEPGEAQTIVELWTLEERADMEDAQGELDLPGIVAEIRGRSSA